MTNITQANETDISAIVELLNISYRGKESKKGWTTEADIIKGNVRTEEKEVRELMQKPNCWFFKCVDSNDKLIGCVNFKKENDKLYLGMFSVLPDLQGKGIGKLFLNKADSFAKSQNCSSVYMQVISVRTKLIDWYKRHGYKFTGETMPFITDEKYGVPVNPLEFIIMEKEI